MKRMLVMTLAAVMAVSPLLSTAAAFEPMRQGQEKESLEGRRGSSRGGRSRRDYDRHRRGRRYHRGSSAGGWVAAGIIGAAVIGGAIASSKSSKAEPVYVYEQPATVVYPGTTSYVYPSTTVVDPSYGYPATTYGGETVVTDPNVYMYDANGNLVPYR